MFPDYKYIRHVILGLSKQTPHVFDIYQLELIETQGSAFIDICHQAENIIKELHKFGSFVKKDWLSLSKLVFQGLCNKELNFISLNSHGLIKGNFELRNKPQYEKNRKIGDILTTLQQRINVTVNYHSILADIDSDFDLDVYEEAWIKNIKYLGDMSGGLTCRMSDIVTEHDYDFFRKLEMFIDVSILNGCINKYENSMSLKLDFQPPDGFIEKQIRAYTSVGLVLEKRFPSAILLDIQKRYYPFEQPFYNFARTSHLPIIYCRY